jgi:glycosyltransferase involved in cell wall biosynthesis
MAQAPLALVCIEPRFPGRLGAVADWLVRRRGYSCHFFCASTDSQSTWPESVGRGLQLVPFHVGGVAREAAVPWKRHLERGLCYAYGCCEVLQARRPRADLVLGRSAGFGSSLFAPVGLPGVPRVNLFDYFYHPHAHDLAEEAGADTPVEYFHWRHAANAMDLLDLENGVTPWTTSRWQRDLYPPAYRADFMVIHDGVDARTFSGECFPSLKRERRANFAYASGSESHSPLRTRRILDWTIPPETRVVSFVARCPDRLRGFDRFMTWANALLAETADVLFIVVGAGPVQRGLDIAFYQKDYQAHVLAQAPPRDPSRFWFLGSVPQAAVAQVLAASDLHVYSSRPYVVSHSLLEAMSAGCVVLAWDSEPVREVITHGQTGLLTAPDDLDAAVRLGRDVLHDPAACRPLGEAARAVVCERYDQDVTLPALAERFETLAL